MATPLTAAICGGIHRFLRRAWAARCLSRVGTADLRSTGSSSWGAGSSHALIEAPTNKRTDRVCLVHWGSAWEFEARFSYRGSGERKFRISDFGFFHRTPSPTSHTWFRGEGSDAPQPRVFSRFGLPDLLPRCVEGDDLPQARRDVGNRRPV